VETKPITPGKTIFMRIDPKKLESLKILPKSIPGPNELRRLGNIFFVGANLPLVETLETMFESFCMESTDLFHLSFGSADNFDKALEMAHQIKKNFSIRLMGQIDFPLTGHVLERAYAAGVDLFTVPFQHIAGANTENIDPTIVSLIAKDSILPHWSLISTIQLSPGFEDEILKNMDSLLDNGIIPLPLLNESSRQFSVEIIQGIYQHLKTGLQKHRVSLKPLLPFITQLTPLVSAKQEGIVSALINKFHDRHLREAADLRRHLRVSAAENSLDSAGL
jgi:hypothetical protein